MADKKISELPDLADIDRAIDYIEVVDSNAGISTKATPNKILGITGNPVGTSDTQTLTNKTVVVANNTISGIANANLSTTAGELGGAFLAHTPTITSGTGTITTASGSTAYIQKGKLVYFTTSITITTNGTGATYVEFTLPVTMKTGRLFVASGRAGAVSGKMLQCYINTTTKASVYNYDNTYPGANGEVLVVSGFYEAA